MVTSTKKISPALRLRERLGTSLTKRPGKVCSGTLWPNGEFTFAYVPAPVTEVTRGEECSWASPAPGDTPEGGSPLDLTLLNNLPGDFSTGTTSTKNQRYGLNGMTSNARRKVRSSAHLLQQRYGKRRLSFLTLTVPPLGDVELERRLAARWHDAIRYLLRRLKQLLRQRELPPFVVGVSEIQVKRYERYGQFPLHVHLVFVGRRRSTGAWCIHYSEFRQAWSEILEGIIGKSIETRYLENVKGVEKDASQYLGKYMSKSQNNVAQVVQDGNEWMLPKQWWFSSIEMKRWLKSESRTGQRCGELLEMMVHEIWDSPGEYPNIWLRKLLIRLDDFEYTAGWMGIIPEEWVDDLKSMLM